MSLRHISTTSLGQTRQGSMDQRRGEDGCRHGGCESFSGGMDEGKECGGTMPRRWSAVVWRMRCRCVPEDVDVGGMWYGDDDHVLKAVDGHEVSWWLSCVEKVKRWRDINRFE